MALLLWTYDLPPKELLEAYGEKGKQWISTVLKQPGVKEFRGYRNPYLTSPKVMTCAEFDTMASLVKFLESQDYATIISEMPAAGCTNISAQVWGTSPIVPEPLRPPAR